MHFSYFDTEIPNDQTIAREVKKLRTYREQVATVIADHDASQPEYSLSHLADPELYDTLESLKKQFKGIKHLVLVGIGGQSLGVRAVHEVLGDQGVTLHSIETIAPYLIKEVLEALAKVKKVSQIAVCVSSKSGNTAETLTNAGVILDALEERYGKAVYDQTIFIGTAGSTMLQTAKRLQAVTVTMPEVVGGRFSIGTEAGFVPLALLKHPVDDMMAGMLDASGEEFEPVVTEGAARLAIYAKKNYRHYNFFAFEPRLAELGKWYRQLMAESLGKATTRSGRELTKGFVPTVSTATELHSTGQLYMSGWEGVYTDFVTFDDEHVDYGVPKTGVAKAYKKFTLRDVAVAIYGGVIGAYQEQTLPYRTTVLSDDLPYSLGVFMGMRMLETMYVAELLDVNAFGQPSVELYKSKTREILKI